MELFNKKSEEAKKDTGKDIYPHGSLFRYPQPVIAWYLSSEGNAGNWKKKDSECIQEFVCACLSDLSSQRVLDKWKSLITRPIDTAIKDMSEKGALLSELGYLKMLKDFNKVSTALKRAKAEIKKIKEDLKE